MRVIIIFAALLMLASCAGGKTSKSTTDVDSVDQDTATMNLLRIPQTIGIGLPFIILIHQSSKTGPRQSQKIIERAWRVLVKALK